MVFGKTVFGVAVVALVIASGSCGPSSPSPATQGKDAAQKSAPAEQATTAKSERPAVATLPSTKGKLASASGPAARIPDYMITNRIGERAQVSNVFRAEVQSVGEKTDGRQFFKTDSIIDPDRRAILVVRRVLFGEGFPAKFAIVFSSESSFDIEAGKGYLVVIGDEGRIIECAKIGNGDVCTSMIPSPRIGESGQQFEIKGLMEKMEKVGYQYP